MAQVIRRTTVAGEACYDVRTRLDGRVSTRTFSRRKDADAYASTIEADKLRGVAVDPRHDRITVDQWCRSWLSLRTDLRPTTQRLYNYLLDSHIVPTIGKIELGKLSPSIVRTWHAELSAEHRPSLSGPTNCCGRASTQRSSTACSPQTLQGKGSRRR